jgi:chromate transport protein ChrA
VPDAGRPDEGSVARLRERLEAERRRIEALEAENAALLAARAEARGRPKAPGGRRSHRFWVALLLVLATILTPVAIVAIFLKNEIGSTDRYVQTVEPLSSNPAIQAYVADDVSDELFARVDIKKYVKDALPKRADPLAGPLTSALQTFVRTAVLKIIETDQFQSLWADANRVAHAQLVNVLTGDESGTVSASKNGAVTIDLSAVTKQVQQRLQASGIDLFSSIPIANIGGKITLFESDDLYKARSGFKILNTLGFVLPFVVLACFGGAIYLSKSRRKGFVASAICFAIGGLILGLSLTVGRAAYLNAATSNHLPYDAAAAAFDTLVRFLRQSVRAVLFLSVIVVVAVFFAGPSRFAVWYRTRVRQGANWLGQESDAAGWDWLGSNGFVVRRKNGLRIAVATVAFLVLFRWKHPTPMVILEFALAVLVLLALVEFFGREPFTDGPATIPTGSGAPPPAPA